MEKNDIFSQRSKRKVPIWFMRQAGRYHKHYQAIRSQHDFMTMCKSPELACEITMGPINDFDFDAAILFSDLLFPLELLNLGLSYESGPPTLKRKLSDRESLKDIFPIENVRQYFSFQKEAVSKIRKELPQDKSLLGFIGSPFTLYTYAVEGKHAGNLISSKLGLYDGRYEKFMELLHPILLEEMSLQAEGNADAICLFDTAAGELSLRDYKDIIVPSIHALLVDFRKKHPNTKVIYYSKMTHLPYLEAINHPFIDVFGVDWRMRLPDVFKSFPEKFVQGNIDPSYLFLPWNILEKKIYELIDELQKENCDLSKWICGLGHGVLPQVPEENVRQFVQLIHKEFS